MRADLPRLRQWSRANGRSFPWRRTRSKYKIAVTELMLIRTRASQVAEIWIAFFRQFPTPRSITTSDPAAVTDALRPLGLSWRADKVLALARALGGRRPWEAAISGQTPGLGPYVRASLRLTERGEGPLPIDVGIARLLGRYYGFTASKDSRRSSAVKIARALTGNVRRSDFHGILDVVSRYCHPRVPACRDCPLLGCAYRRRDETSLNTESSSVSSSSVDRTDVSRPRSC